MTRDDIIKMAREAGAMFDHMTWVERDLAPVFERFAALVAAAEREKVAAWMMERGYATGHGNTIEELLKELEWQIREREREACAKVCDGMDHNGVMIAADCAAAIRARSKQ
jgi:hypothetical protein